MLRILLAALVLALLIGVLNATEISSGAVRQLPLTSHWTFREETKSLSYPASVPGCVHTDLLRNGLIPDPFFGLHEKELQWIGEKDWIYQTTFDVPAEFLNEEKVEIIFLGLDTYASVTLNDSPILSANDMFREWRIDCKKLLKQTGNTLSVRFRNIFDENLPKYKGAPFRLQAFDNNDQAETKISMYSRKAQFHYGWDWGPRLITCGIWRPVYLEAWSGFRIKNVHIQQRNVSVAGADIVSVVEILSNSDQSANITVTMDNAVLSQKAAHLKGGKNTLILEGHLTSPTLWWTNGLGSQYLYKYLLAVKNNRGATDALTENVGVRSLEVVRDKDTSGRSMYIRLNGVPVFMKGSNYIPQDNFQDRVTKERYEHIIRSAADANMNMLRVWGGGIYEDDLFYDLCDKYGILVWQEMIFACAMYPADEEFLANVHQEVVDNVVRIRNHSSIAMYCGNNENEAAWYQWGWKEKYDEQTRRAYDRDLKKLFYDVIPSALREADSTRYYHPSSPIADINNVPPSEGDTHYWGVWHGKHPFEKFSSNVSRFVSEYGFQSYPELSTVLKYTRPEDRQLHSDVILSHQRCMADERRDKEYGNRLIQTYMDQWFRTPKDFESYLYVSQVLQAAGVKMGMEAHRRSMPYCMGSLYWQIDDCWPVASWSSIDYYGRWKALHYAAKNSYAPILISPVVTIDKVSIVVVSDKLQGVDAVLDLKILDFDGVVVSQRSIPLSVKPNCSKPYVEMEKHQLIGTSDESRLVLYSRLVNGEEILAENLAYFKPAKELKLVKPMLTAGVTRNRDGVTVTIEANTFAKNVLLTCGDEDAFFSDNYFDMLPGTKKSITVTTKLSQGEFERTLKIISLVDSYE
jgi:beta-mannosidase